MAIIVQDSFNRADASALGSADTGQSWVVGGATTITYGIFSNRGGASAANSDNNAAFINIDMALRDYRMTIKVPTMQAASAQVFRVYPRVALNNGTFCYYLALVASNTGYAVTKRTAQGSLSTVASTAVMPAHGDTIQIEHFASGQVDFYVNGTKITTITDSHMLTVSYGVGFGGGQNPVYRVDDFLVEDVAVAGTVITKTLTDTVVLSESFAKAATKPAITDSITLSDTFSKRLSVTVIDTLPLTDGTTSRVGKAVSLADSIAITDAISKVISRVQTDTVTVFETKKDAITRRLNDTLSLSDVITASKGKAVILTDAIVVTDSIGKAALLRKIDAITASDTFNRTAARSVALYDVIVTSEALAKTLPNAPTLIGSIPLSGERTLNVYLIGSRELDVTLRGDIG